MKSSNDDPPIRSSQGPIAIESFRQGNGNFPYEREDWKDGGSQRYCIVIVHVRRMVAEALASALSEGGIGPLGIADTEQDALMTVAEHQPDLVLMHAVLSGTDGIALGRKLQQRSPDIKILVMTSLLEPGLVRKVLQLGFVGCLTKDTSLSQFVVSVKAALAGQVVIPKRPAVHTASERSPEEEDALRRAAHLTRRELEVLTLLTNGATSREISGRLSLTRNTVRSHVQNVLTKLQVRSRLEAARFAVRYGITERVDVKLIAPFLPARLLRWFRQKTADTDQTAAAASSTAQAGSVIAPMTRAVATFGGMPQQWTGYAAERVGAIVTAAVVGVAGVGGGVVGLAASSVSPQRFDYAVIETVVPAATSLLEADQLIGTRDNRDNFDGRAVPTVSDLEEVSEIEPPADTTEPPPTSSPPPGESEPPPDSDACEPPADTTEPPPTSSPPRPGESEPPPPDTDACEPPADTTEPPPDTDATPPDAEMTEPPADTTEPPADTTEPPADTTEPPAAPSTPSPGTRV